MSNTQSMQVKAYNFAYITFKMQANMCETDTKFYGLESTVDRICSCIIICIDENTALLLSAKQGIVDAFNRLKNEENLPILSYDTISDILKQIDDKSQRRSA